MKGFIYNKIRINKMRSCENVICGNLRMNGIDDYKEKIYLRYM